MVTQKNGLPFEVKDRMAGQVRGKSEPEKSFIARTLSSDDQVQRRSLPSSS
jgi:hypothetical protein